MGGIPSRDILLILKEEQKLPHLDVEGIAHEKEEEYVKMMSRVVLIDTIASIARENLGKLPMAIATGGRRSIWIEFCPSWESKIGSTPW